MSIWALSASGIAGPTSPSPPGASDGTTGRAGKTSCWRPTGSTAIVAASATTASSGTSAPDRVPSVRSSPWAGADSPSYGGDIRLFADVQDDLLASVVQ